MFGLSCHQFPHGGRWQGFVILAKQVYYFGWSKNCELSFWGSFFLQSTTHSGVVVDGGLILTGGFDREGLHTNIR